MKTFQHGYLSYESQTYGTSLLNFTCSKPAGWHSGWNHLVTHWALSRYSFQNLQMSQLEDLRLPPNYRYINWGVCWTLTLIILLLGHAYLSMFSLLFVYPELFEVWSSTGVSLLDTEHCLVRGGLTKDVITKLPALIIVVKGQIVDNRGLDR